MGGSDRQATGDNTTQIELAKKLSNCLVPRVQKQNNWGVKGVKSRG